MNANAVLDIAMQGLLVTAKLAAPIGVTALVGGCASSRNQSTPQIPEVTLSSGPKAAAVAVALIICGQWMISELVSFTHVLFEKIPMLLGGG